MENTQSEQTTVKEQAVKTASKVASNKKLAIVLVRGFRLLRLQ